MTTNIFMNFDPYTLNIKINNLFLMNMMMFIPMNMWKIKFTNNSMMNKNKMNKNNNLMMKILMLTILTMNILNIMPLNNFPSSNPNNNLTLSLMFWLSTIMFNNLYNKKIILINFTISKINSLLYTMIIMIEMMSKIMQTITLTIRLTINMMMSHIIMSIFNSMMMMTILPYEMFVVTIQTYVFFMLMNMYFNEMF